DHVRHLSAVVPHCSRKGKTSFFNRLDGLIGRAGYFVRELLAFFSESGKNAAALFRKNRGHLGTAPADGSRNFVGLADEAARDFFARADKSALRITRTGADCFGR